MKDEILTEVVTRAKAGDKTALAYVSSLIKEKAIKNLKCIEKQNELEVINNIKGNIERLSQSVVQVAHVVDSNNAVIGDAITKSKRNSKRVMQEHSQALSEQLNEITQQIQSIQNAPIPERVIENRTVVEKIIEQPIINQPISINEVFDGEDEECTVEYVEQGAIDKLFKEFEYRLRRDIQNQMDLRQYVGSGGGRGGGGAIEIKYDGETITKEAECLNFQGEDVLVQDDGSGCLNIYIPPPAFSITSFVCNPNLIEAGDIINSIAMNWTYSVLEVINQTVTGPGIIDPITDESRNTIATITSDGFTNLSYLLSADDKLTGINDTANCGLLHGLNQYWGRSPVIPTTEAEIQALISNRFVTGKDSTIAFGTTAQPEYTLFCYPAAYGPLGDVINPDNNFNIPVVEYAQVDVFNGFGYGTPYRVYAANQLQAGAITWSFAGNSGVQLPPSL